MKLHSTTAFIVVLSLANSATVFAQTAPSAAIEAQHRRGMALRAQRHDEEARTLFEHLWNRTHEPRARARQALAEHSLDMFAEAEAHLVEALSHQEDPWIRQSRSVLEPILQQARAGQGISVLNVVCATPGAEIFVNGRSAGHAGELLRVPPGRITFEVRSRGFTTVSRSIELQAGAILHEEVALVQTVQTVQAAPTATNPQGPTRITAGTVIVTPPPPASSGSGIRTVAWITAGFGVAGGIATGVFLVLQIAPAAHWNSHDCDSQSMECLAARDTALSWQPAEGIGIVVGGTFAVTSAVLFIVSALGPAPRREPTTRAQVSCSPGMGVGAGTASLSCNGTF